MLKRMSIVAFGALLVAVIAPSAFATAALNLQLVYVQSVPSNSTTTPIVYSTPITNGGTIPAGMVNSTDRHRFAFLFSITGQASDESLQGYQLRVTRTGWSVGSLPSTTGALGPYSYTNPSWDPDSDSDGFPEPRNLFGINSADAGLTLIRGLTDAANDWYAAQGLNPGEASDKYMRNMSFTLDTPNIAGVYTLVMEKEGTASTGYFKMWQGGTGLEGGGTGIDVDYTPNINNALFTLTVVDVIPEPATFMLMGLGAPALALVARRRMRRDT